MRRFIPALLLAPLAGMAVAMALSVVVVFSMGTSAERTVAGLWHFAWFIGFWTLIICAAYTIVLGSAAFAISIARRRPLSLAIALLTGLVLGGLPFSILSLRRETGPPTGAAWLFPALAILCSLVTAWTFWRVALREATPPRQPLPVVSSDPASSSPGT
jgi:hypothetical protein